MFKAITQRPFWVNLLVAIAILFLLFFLFLQSLQFFTHHGSYLKVPDVNNKNIKEATDLLNKQGFEVMVQDSVYYDTLAPLVVVKQFPEPDASVKVNRIVYLTINRAVPPEIEMPNLVGMSFRSAQLELKARGLKLGDTSYKPDIAKNSVLEQLYKNTTIKPGTKITMGTTISLVLAAGVGNEDMMVPDLFGMTYEEAKAMLDANNIILGNIGADGEIKDTAASYVSRQQPPRYNDDGTPNRIRPGQMVDIWISLTRPEKRSNDSTNATPAVPATGDKQY
ncbi:MAG: PASTA domain-containing protein [Agriterribacter sp.]